MLASKIRTQPVANIDARMEAIFNMKQEISDLKEENEKLKLMLVKPESYAVFPPGALALEVAVPNLKPTGMINAPNAAAKLQEERLKAHRNKKQSSKPVRKNRVSTLPAINPKAESMISESTPKPEWTDYTTRRPILPKPESRMRNRPYESMIDMRPSESRKPTPFPFNGERVKGNVKVPSSKPAYNVLTVELWINRNTTRLIAIPCRTCPDLTGTLQAKTRV
jgi:hypothetical protein